MNKITLLLTLMFALVASPALAAVRSLSLTSVYATLADETAQVGKFASGDRIDLLYQFQLDADGGDTAHLAWNVLNRYDSKVSVGSRDMSCQPGANSLRIEDAIPTNLGAGTQTYSVLASIEVGGKMMDATFEIRIENHEAVHYVTIEDVRLTPKKNDPLEEDLRGAAIPYVIEVDFRVESVVDWWNAQIRWLGATSDGFILDRGIGAISIKHGENKFTIESYLARPPQSAIRQATFSVDVGVAGYTDTVTFPIETLPTSLAEYQSRAAAPSGELDFSIGEAFFVTEDGARASVFARNEPMTARLLTNGKVPQDCKILMTLRDTIDKTQEEFTNQPEPGKESPSIDFKIPENESRVPGSYEFTWTVVVGNTMYADRRANLTLSGKTGSSIPKQIQLPGTVKFSAPLDWNVTEETQGGRFATMVTPDSITCELFGQDVDEPLHAAFLADLFESDVASSHLPSDKKSLTDESDRKEGTWEYVRRAYLGGGHVYVMSYWLYRVGEGQYEFLIARCVGSEDQVEKTYAASDAIRAGLDFDS